MAVNERQILVTSWLHWDVVRAVICLDCPQHTRRRCICSLPLYTGTSQLWSSEYSQGTRGSCGRGR